MSYIDVKSKGLRDVLRKVLKDIRRIYLREDKPLVQKISAIKTRWLISRIGRIEPPI